MPPKAKDPCKVSACKIQACLKGKLAILGYVITDVGNPID